MLYKNKLCVFTLQRVPEFISMFTVLRQFLLLSTISAFDSRVTKFHARHTLLMNIRVLVSRIPDIKTTGLVKQICRRNSCSESPRPFSCSPHLMLFALDYHFGFCQSSHKIISHDIHYFDLRIDHGTFPAYREHKKQVPGSPRVPSRVADMEQ